MKVHNSAPKRDGLVVSCNYRGIWSLLLGGMLNALITIGVALVALKLKNIWLRFAVVVVSAYLSAHLLFEAWLWWGPADDQTSSWGFVFVNGWFLAGIVPGCAVVLIAASLSRRNE